MKQRAQSLVGLILAVLVLGLWMNVQAAGVPISIATMKQKIAQSTLAPMLPVGMKVSIQQRSINYMAQQMMPFIQKMLTQPINVPDVNGEVGKFGFVAGFDHFKDTPIGHISYSLSSIVLSGLSLSTPSIQITAQGLEVSISSAQAHMHCVSLN